MAKTCDCPMPPGGSITCSDDQLAMCGYQDGRIVSGCFDPPPAIPAMPTRGQRVTALNNWVLEQLTGEDRRFDQEITPPENAILLSGEYVDRRGNKLTFVIPTKVRVSSEGGASASAAG